MFTALEPPVILPRGTCMGSAISVACATKFQSYSLGVMSAPVVYPDLILSGRLSRSGMSGPASSSSTDRRGSSESRVARMAPADPAPMTITSYFMAPPSTEAVEAVPRVRVNPPVPLPV